MNKYRIFETTQFSDDVEQITTSQQFFVKEKLKNFVYLQLKTQPFFGKNIKKLKNYKPDTWRYRIGDYRFFYEINDQEKIVFMMSADHRQDAY